MTQPFQIEIQIQSNLEIINEHLKNENKSLKEENAHLQFLLDKIDVIKMENALALKKSDELLRSIAIDKLIYEKANNALEVKESNDHQQQKIIIK